jgi:hypothetical protein
MVEATAMVYKVMEEQHKMDSSVPKEPAILKDEMHLNEFALQLCHTHGINIQLSLNARSSYTSHFIGAVGCNTAHNASGETADDACETKTADDDAKDSATRATYSKWPGPTNEKQC